MQSGWPEEPEREQQVMRLAWQPMMGRTGGRRIGESVLRGREVRVIAEPGGTSGKTLKRPLSLGETGMAPRVKVQKQGWAHDRRVGPHRDKVQCSEVKPCH